MIQDLGQHIYHNEYFPREPRAGDILFVFEKGQVLAATGPNGSIRFPDVMEASGQAMQFLFTIDDTAFFLGC